MDADRPRSHVVLRSFTSVPGAGLAAPAPSASADAPTRVARPLPGRPLVGSRAGLVPSTDGRRPAPPNGGPDPRLPNCDPPHSTLRKPRLPCAVAPPPKRRAHDSTVRTRPASCPRRDRLVTVPQSPLRSGHEQAGPARPSGLAVSRAVPRHRSPGSPARRLDLTSPSNGRRSLGSTPLPRRPSYFPGARRSTGRCGRSGPGFAPASRTLVRTAGPGRRRRRRGGRIRRGSRRSDPAELPRFRGVAHRRHSAGQRQ